MEICNETKGRRQPEKPKMMIKDHFLYDCFMIRNSKAHRRLDGKTQVMTFPDNPHVRTRGMHTREVATISEEISLNLGLNTYLCRAIAEGHDIGHAPYGHIGESVLSELGGKPFKHYINSVVVAQNIERRGTGLNMTYEVCEGILNHSRGSGELHVDNSKPQEYSVVMFSDKIAYIFSDLNDAYRYGYIKKEPEFAKKIGVNQRERVKNTIKALIDESIERGYVSFSDGLVFEYFDRLKKFMYEEVYSKVDHTTHNIQRDVLYNLYEFFKTDEEFEGIDPIVAVSLLTDREANRSLELMASSRRLSDGYIKNFGIYELLPYIRKPIDYTDPDIDWKEFHK